MDAQAAQQADFAADKVRTLIAEYLHIDARQVTDEAHFSDDLGIDWLDQLELLIMIEEQFPGVEFSDTDQIEVVGDLVRYIETTNKAVKNHPNAASLLRKSAA